MIYNHVCSPRTGGLIWWKVSTTEVEEGSQADPVDIEVTSYVLLALLASGTQKDLERGAPIVRWLTSQRNAEGGFASTQVSRFCEILIALLFNQFSGHI